ncbi:MAG TPA: hypothetical protein VGE72_30930 [Azospirillum sp.]
MTKVFVVDTCVGHAAGGPDATFPLSKHSRDFLLLLREAGHKVAFDPASHDEWKAHRSRFAYTWLTSMYAKRRVILADEEVGDAVLVPLAAAKDLADHHRKAIAKDAPVVATALAHDRLLASVDGRLLTALLEACRSMACVQGLVWIDVAGYCEELAAWVHKAAGQKKLPAAGNVPITVLK